MKIFKEKKGFVVDGDVFDCLDFDGDFCIGILIDNVPDKDALMVTNQVGGTACGHPEVRGLPMKLPTEWAPADAAIDPLRDYYLNLYRSDLVNAFLAACKLENVFEPLALEDVPGQPPMAWGDEDRYRMCLAEAWVPVRVKYEQPHAFLRPFEGQRMILTYMNSD